ncbi:MAG: hypothetical protein HY860_02575 [Chlamydiales bacterium]|nr:hypothetical protein [Chlamydiales bacterium]
MGTIISLFIKSPLRNVRKNLIQYGTLILLLTMFSIVLVRSNTLFQHDPIIDFDQSMKKDSLSYKKCLQSTGNYGICSMSGNAVELLKFLRDLYKQNQPWKAPRSQEVRIPRIAHWVWLGSPLPEQLLERIEKFKNLHPDWECRIWTETEVNAFNLKNRAFYDQGRNWGEKANIVRYEILEKFGGVYLDWDIDCIKSLEAFHYTYDLYCGISTLDTSVLNICNAVIGSVAHHPILQHCMETIAQDKLLETEMLSKLGNGVNPATGPIHFTKSFIAKAKEPGWKNIAFPSTFFYPLGPSQKSLSKEEQQEIIENTPEAYLVHFWAGSWVDQH